MTTSTPWGPAQQSKTIAHGIVRYSTASHGGYHLTKGRVDAMPRVMRELMDKIGAIESDGEAWLEEDNAWALVAFAFPSEFSLNDVTCAEVMMKNHFPDTWEAITGKQLKPGQSRIRDELCFAEANKHNHVAIRSYWHLYEHVTDGMIGLATTVGGVHHRDAEETYWLVPEKEFNANPHHFVVDPSRHERLTVKLGAYKAQFAKTPAALAAKGDN